MKQSVREPDQNGEEIGRAADIDGKRRWRQTARLRQIAHGALLPLVVTATIQEATCER